MTGKQEFYFSFFSYTFVMSTYHIILAGGGGTRLWPLSTQSAPKQFMDIGDGKTLLDHALDRVEACDADADKILISTIQGLEPHIEPILAQRQKNITLITEPARRNTAPAYAFALVNLLHQGASMDDVVVVTNSDHLISPLDTFARYIQAGVAAALKLGHIIIFGIQPTSPDTGYGYIQTGTSFGEYSKVIAFQEKPNEATAQKYLLNGGYLWNSGMYLGKIGDFVREFREHAPEIAQIFETKNIAEATEMYPSLPETQIDQAISEKTKNISVIPMHILWSDVGTWDRLYSISALDENRNTLRGEVVVDDVTSSLLWNMDDERLLVAEGVEDLVVVQTKEATYIAPRTKASKIKKLLEKIPKEKR